MQVKKRTTQKVCDRRSKCPISAALEMFGDKWTLLIVRDMILFGKSTFGEFQNSPEGIATNILTDRLQRLEVAGMVEGSDDPENKRRTIYKLTTKGADLWPVLAQIIIWSAKHDSETVVSKELLKSLERDPDGVLRKLQKSLAPS